MYLFHGTSYNRLMQILKDGYIGCEELVWNVSQPQTTYFWSQREIYADNIDYEEEDAYNEAFRHAIESAEMAVGTERENMRRVVIVIDQDSLSSLEEGELRSDESCTMDYAVQFDAPIPVEKIERVFVDKNNLDLFGFYFIGMNRNINNRRQAIYKVKEADLPDEIKDLAMDVYNKLSMNWYETMYDIDDMKEFTINKVIK